ERIFLNTCLWEKLKGKKENLPQAVRNDLSYYVRYNQTAFDFLLNHSSQEKKVFCFTHFFFPHEPYAYTRSTIDSLSLGDISDPQGYLVQVEHANKLIKKIVTELKKD